MTLCMKMPSGAAITDMMTPPWGLFYGGPPTDTDGGNGLALLLSQKLGSYNVRALPISRARPSLLRNSPARFGLTKTSRALWSSPEVLLKFRLPVRGIGSQLQSLEWEPSPLGCIIPRGLLFRVSCDSSTPSACCHITAKFCPRAFGPVSPQLLLLLVRSGEVC